MSRNRYSSNHPEAFVNIRRTGMRPNWRGFPIQVLVFTILPITVMLLAVVIGSQALHHQAMRNLVGERDLRTAQIAASSLEQRIERDAELFQQISYRYITFPEHLSAFFEQETAKGGFQDGLAIFSSTGELIERSGAIQSWEPFIPILFADDTQQTQIGQVEIQTVALSEKAPGTGATYYLVFSIPVNTDSVLIGAESVPNLIEENFSEAVSVMPQTKFIVVGTGQSSEMSILFQSNAVEDDLLSSQMDAIVQARTGTGQIRYDQTHAGERVHAFASADPPGWVLIIQENWEDIASPSLLNTQIAPLVMIPVLILAVFLLWFGIRRIVFPLQSLEKEATDLADGDFNAIRQPVGGIEEIQSLQNTMLNMAGKLETAQGNLHSYIGALTAGVESERKNLARDLHDDTIQSLIALNQRIQWMLSYGGDSEKAQLVELQSLVQETIQNLRRMIRGMRPIYLEDLGLAASIEMLTHEISQIASIPVSFETFGIERRIDSHSEIAIYRIVQEALHNVVRHAQAHQAWVELEYSDEGLSVQIRDDGRGFDVLENKVQFAQEGHFGLLGMKERAELIGADLIVTSVLSQGTTVLLKIKQK